MWSISSGIAHGVKEKIYILEVLGGFSLNDIVLMEYLWKSTFNEDRIESVKEPLLACIFEQRSNCISRGRSSFNKDILEKRYVILWRLTDLQ